MKQYDRSNYSWIIRRIIKFKNDKMRLSHFMIPFINKNNIKRSDSISGFFENEECSDFF